MANQQVHIIRHPLEKADASCFHLQFSDSPHYQHIIVSLEYLTCYKSHQNDLWQLSSVGVGKFFNSHEFDQG